MSSKKVLIEFRGNTCHKISIPRLKSRGGAGIKLPKIDYTTMEPTKDQSFEVSEDEANDLIRSWPTLFQLKRTRKEEKRIGEVVVDGC